MAQKPLRAVSAGERRKEPPTLAEAVASGDVLDMLMAQRRLIAESLVGAAENTRPQLNNELNKLHVLIREEQARRVSEQQEKRADGRVVSDEAWEAI
jgi:hypothetical protein